MAALATIYNNAATSISTQRGIQAGPSSNECKHAVHLLQKQASSMKNPSLAMSYSWRDSSAFGSPRQFSRALAAGSQSSLEGDAASVRASCEDHKELVKESWKILRKDASTYGLQFFLKVFEIAPTVKQLFSFLRDTDVPLEKNPHLKAHALTVFSTTCEAAVVLGEDPTLAALRPKLLELGQSHVIHKVRDEHFDVVKYALLETLRDALKENWTPEMKAAWSEAYDAVTDVIKDEMHSQLAAAAAAAASKEALSSPQEQSLIQYVCPSFLLHPTTSLQKQISQPQARKSSTI